MPACRGNSNSDISGDKTDTNSRFGFDAWLVKLDKDGNIQWQKTIYSTNYNMKFYDLDGIPGGGYIMVSGAGLTKLDSTGNIIWVQAPQAGHGLYFCKAYIRWRICYVRCQSMLVYRTNKG